MKKPLILKQGLLQGAEEKIRISQLNLGLRQTIVVTSDQVEIFSNLHHFIGQGFFADRVRTIVGGEEGDLLFLTGSSVRLISGGNIAVRNVRLQTDKYFLLLNIGSVWIPSL